MKETPERPEAIIDPPDRSFPLLKTIRWVNWNKLKVISGYSRYFNDLLVGKLSGLSVTACLALSLEARRELGGGGGELSLHHDSSIATPQEYSKADQQRIFDKMYDYIYTYTCMENVVTQERSGRS